MKKKHINKVDEVMPDTIEYLQNTWVPLSISLLNQLQGFYNLSEKNKKAKLFFITLCTDLLTYVISKYMK